MVCAQAARVDFPSFNLVQVAPKEVTGGESRSGLRKERRGVQSKLNLRLRGHIRKSSHILTALTLGNFIILLMQSLTVSVCERTLTCILPIYAFDVITDSERRNYLLKGCPQFVWKLPICE